MGNQDGKKWIFLNVGGTYFMTNKSTLTKGTPPNSPLHRVSTNSTNIEWDRDDKGAYMIDRDPSYFQPVLNYLRHGTLILNKDVCEEGVLLEAEYFHVPELIRLLRQRIEFKHFNSTIVNANDANAAAAAAAVASYNNQSSNYLNDYLNYIMQDNTVA